MFNKSRMLGAALLIASTTVGAGMIALPSFTGPGGFIPSVLTLVLCWAYMFLTGLFVVQACLWLKTDSFHLARVAYEYTGKSGKAICTILFLFLYLTLLTSYFSGLSPYLSSQGSHGYLSIFLFSFVLLMIYMGTKAVDQVNRLLIFAMGGAFGVFLWQGLTTVKGSYLWATNFSFIFNPLPIMIGAFGYHNLIPSLVVYLKKDKGDLWGALLLGTLIPLMVYLLWLFITMGSIEGERWLDLPSDHGIPVLQVAEKMGWQGTFLVALRGFCFLGIFTSLMGVALSMVDFIGDLKIPFPFGRSRFFISFLTLSLPFLLSFHEGSSFVRYFGIASGFGETLLNSFFPILFAYLGVKSKGFLPHYKTVNLVRYWPVLVLLGFVVMYWELLHLGL